MHSFSECRDALISAPSTCLSLEWYMESLRRSVPAQSTSMSCPSDWKSRSVQMAWLLELTELASVAEVARRDCAISITAHSSSGVTGKRSTAPSAMYDPSCCSRSRSSGRSLFRPSPVLGARRSKQRLPRSSMYCTDRQGSSPLVPSKRSRAASSWIALIVWVFPLPVCPNMNMVPIPPSRELWTSCRAADLYTSALSDFSSKTRSKSKVRWLTKGVFRSA
mmetsp:Transcript_59468/g.167532  ORF Transcript_59468/g.167532 Transcript_59468/m.167532 type:complete len:221 (+) Transcript_59468:103-765(+)